MPFKKKNSMGEGNLIPKKCLLGFFVGEGDIVGCTVLVVDVAALELGDGEMLELVTDADADCAQAYDAHKMMTKRAEIWKET